MNSCGLVEFLQAKIKRPNSFYKSPRPEQQIKS